MLVSCDGDFKGSKSFISTAYLHKHSVASVVTSDSQVDMTSCAARLRHDVTSQVFVKLFSCFDMFTLSSSVAPSTLKSSGTNDLSEQEVCMKLFQTQHNPDKKSFNDLIPSDCYLLTSITETMKLSNC